MEIKLVRKMASLSLLLLLSGITLGSTSRVTLAQESRPSSPATVTDAPSMQAPSAPSQSDFSGVPPSNTAKPEIPTWLWFVLGGLTVWNVLLSYLVWKNFENFDRKVYRNEKKLQDLEAKDIALDHRIDRKMAPIDELARKVESCEISVSALQVDMRTLGAKRSQSAPIEKKVNTVIQTKIQPSDHKYSSPSVSRFSQSDGYASNSPASKNPWDSIVQNYNYSPQVLETYIVEKVSETEESLTNRRNSSNAPILLKTTNNANYWIFNGEDQNSWLVPKSDLKLTPISYDTFQALFDCQDYQPNLKLQILKPAKVSYNFATSAWELAEKGQVQFTR